MTDLTANKQKSQFQTLGVYLKPKSGSQPVQLTVLQEVEQDIFLVLKECPFGRGAIHVTVFK